MSSITSFIKKKINQVRYGHLRDIEETPAVNMTRILLNPRNILILPYNRMGTILLATRVFKSLREHYASSKITVAVHEPWSVLITKDPTIDHVIAFGDDIENPHSRGFMEIGRSLEEQNFDLAFFLSYQFDPVMAYLTRLSNALLRVSFKGDFDVPFFNVEIIPAQGSRYEVERYLEMFRSFGIEGSVRDYTMKISPGIKEKARLRYLSGLGASSETQRYIGFDLTHEITGEPINKKSAEQMIHALISAFDAYIIVFFEPSKKSLAAELKESFGRKVIPVEDRPISLAAGLISFCRFVVAYNTDLFQLVVALKTPTLGILTPQEMVQWSPGENDALVHVNRPGISLPSPQELLQASKKLINQTKKTES